MGYAAPLGKVHALFRSFRLESPREVFSYDVRVEGIVVTREPGPTKTLDPTPRALEELRPPITAANDWCDPQSFLRRLVYAAHVGGEYTHLNGFTLRRFRPSGLETSTLEPERVPEVLRDVFGANPGLDHEAVAVQARLSAMPPLSH